MYFNTLGKTSKKGLDGVFFEGFHFVQALFRLGITYFSASCIFTIYFITTLFKVVLVYCVFHHRDY